MTMNAEHPVRVAVGLPTANGRQTVAPVSSNERSQATQTPLIDIYEGPDGLVLEADLPGVAGGDVSIQLEDNVLTLTAKVASPDQDPARLVHEEYRHGDFQRSFILSDEVDRDKISAELNHGVLRLTLPKAERAKTRRIEIKTS